MKEPLHKFLDLCLKDEYKRKCIIQKPEIKKHYSGWLVSKVLTKTIEENFDKIIFGFKNSIIVLIDGSIISNSPKTPGIVYPYEQVLRFTVKEKGIISKGEIVDENSNVIGTVIGNDIKDGYQMFKFFHEFIKDNPIPKNINTQKINHPEVEKEIDQTLLKKKNEIKEPLHKFLDLCLKDEYKRKCIIQKPEIKKHYGGWGEIKVLTKTIEENFDKIIFGFKGSIIVLIDGSIISNKSVKLNNGIVVQNPGIVYPYEQVLRFTVKEKGIISKGEIVDGNSCAIGQPIGHPQIFKDFQKFIKDNPHEKIIRKREKNKEKKTKLLKEINEIFSISKKLFDLSEEQNKLKNENELKNKSIFNEKILNNFPNQTYGSVVFHNELNKNSILFDNSHLNKITRFLGFIENHEDKYLRLYNRCVTFYIDLPHDKCFNELIIKLETINHYYEIMKSLIHNVNKDKVLYNKLYNLIEDEGIFMTKTEKDTLNYMKNISSGIISLNNNIVDGFKHLTKEVSTMSSELSDLDYSLSMISGSLDDIYMNLPDNTRR